MLCCGSIGAMSTLTVFQVSAAVGFGETGSQYNYKKMLKKIVGTGKITN